MKFTKEEFSETLKNKLTNEGKKSLSMSARSFNEEIEELYNELKESEKADEIELENIVSKKIKHFERIDNNMRKDNSDFIKEWQKNHPEKEKNADNNSGNDNKLDVLLKEIQNLKDEREKGKSLKAISDKRISLKSALKNKDVKNEDWIDSQLELISITPETDVDALTEKLVGNYNKFNSNTPSNVTPQSAGSNAENETDYADVVAIVKKHSQRK